MPYTPERSSGAKNAFGKSQLEKEAQLGAKAKEAIGDGRNSAMNVIAPITPFA
jgi:hypothetical protein